MANVLVVGGAGYIGSHMVDALVKKIHFVVVLDNLSTGFKESVLDAELIIGSLSDQNLLEKIFAKYQFDIVMHFASFIQVEESVREPYKYYKNNVIDAINLLNVMLKHKVRKIIFSSSAAVYGDPKYLPIDEKHSKNPINPYGFTKLMFERILSDYDKAYGLKSISLRYFNASGSDPLGRFGIRNKHLTHLIPIILQVASKKREFINIFGTDYDTSDGTCVRDYIHVVDLCEAHLLALDALIDGFSTKVYNLGNEKGHSVLEVIETARNVTQKSICAIKCDRRLGDSACLIADSTLAKKELKWQPKFSDLKTIIKHSWNWELNKEY